MRIQTQSLFFAIGASAAASLCLLAAAAPAFARGPVDMTIATSRPAPSAGDADKKICMKETEPMTGTRLLATVCKTRAQWEAEGYTVTTRAKGKAPKR